MRKAIRYHIVGVAIALWHAAERAVQKALKQRGKSPNIAAGLDGRAVVTAALARSMMGHHRLRHTASALVLEIDGFQKVEKSMIAIALKSCCLKPKPGSNWRYKMLML